MRLLLVAIFLLTILVGTGCAGPKAITNVTTMPQMHVAYAEYMGDYDQNPEQYGELLATVVTWADKRSLFNFPDKTQLVTIFPDELNNVQNDLRRLRVGVTVPEGTRTAGRVQAGTLPGGRYLVGHYIIEDDEIDAAWLQMFEKHLPKTGLKVGSGPLFMIQTNDPDHHPERKNVIDLYIPVTSDR